MTALNFIFVLALATLGAGLITGVVQWRRAIKAKERGETSAFAHHGESHPDAPRSST